MTTPAILPHCFDIDRRETIGFRAARPEIAATFLGIQSGFGVMPDIELWNLEESIPGHPIGSTVSRQTIVTAGYLLPLRNAA